MLFSLSGHLGLGRKSALLTPWSRTTSPPSSNHSRAPGRRRTGGGGRTSPKRVPLGIRPSVSETSVASSVSVTPRVPGQEKVVEPRGATPVSVEIWTLLFCLCHVFLLGEDFEWSWRSGAKGVSHFVVRRTDMDGNKDAPELQVSPEILFGCDFSRQLHKQVH